MPGIPFDPKLTGHWAAKFSLDYAIVNSEYSNAVLPKSVVSLHPKLTMHQSNFTEMQPQMPGNHPELSMYDEVSTLLKTRLEYHEWQLKHHQQRVNEIQDMYQYLNMKFGPQPTSPQPESAETAEPVATMTEEAMPVTAEEEPVAAGETEQQPDAAQAEPVADESLLRPYAEAQGNGHEGGQHQPMY
jgi:hypothetical protein